MRKNAARMSARVAKIEEDYSKRREKFSTGAEYMDSVLASIDKDVEEMEQDLTDSKFGEVREDLEHIEIRCREFEEL